MGSPGQDRTLLISHPSNESYNKGTAINCYPPFPSALFSFMDVTFHYVNKQLETVVIS